VTGVTVLVTGAGGFVGSAVVRALVAAAGDGSGRLADGSPVESVVAVLRPGGSTDRLETVEGSPLLTIAEADVASPAFADLLAVERPVAIVHAALPATAYERFDYEAALEPLRAAFASLALVEGGRLLHAGSAWTLAAGLDLAEDAPLVAGTPYTRTKVAEDGALAEFGRQEGVPWFSLRLFNLFGRYEAPTRLLPTLVDRLSQGLPAELSRGDQVRDFTDVDDAARAFVAALAAPSSACNRVIHIGSGRATSTRELAAMVADILGRDDLLRFGARETEDAGVPALTADPARAHALLGWRPGAPLERRVREAVEWWLARRPVDRTTKGAAA